MAGKAPSRRSVIVVAGSEQQKERLTGSIIYRLGLDLPTLEQLEKANRSRYEDNVPILRENNIEPSFSTPKSQCRFVGNVTEAEIAICVLDITKPTADAYRIMEKPEIAKVFANGRKVVVVIDGMGEVEWRRQPYDVLVRAVKERYGATRHVDFVPISSVHGDNIFELSTKSSWYSEQPAPTVLEAIDG